jgi:two-component system response regulator RpaA
MARMLVIEDDRALTYVIRQILEARGHEVLSADDGSRGVATAQRRSPDAIVLDLMMPFMDGFAVLEALRRDERTANVPVTVLSALQRESVEERCYRLGAKQYFRKPFDPDVLVGSLEELVSDRHRVSDQRAPAVPTRKDHGGTP